MAKVSISRMGRRYLLQIISVGPVAAEETSRSSARDMSDHNRATNEVGASARTALVPSLRRSWADKRNFNEYKPQLLLLRRLKNEFNC